MQFCCVCLVQTKLIRSFLLEHLCKQNPTVNGSKGQGVVNQWTANMKYVYREMFYDIWNFIYRNNVLSIKVDGLTALGESVKIKSVDRI